MTCVRALLALELCVVLGACAVEQSLGSHEPALRHDAAPDGQQPGTAPEAAEPEPGSTAGSTPDVGEAAPPAHEPTPDAAIEEPPADGPPAEEPPPAQEPPPAEEPPAEEPPPDEPPPMDPPQELPAVCTAATDDTCRLCRQDACCEALHACSESEVCHCRLECRDTAEPAACAEGCGAVPDALELLDACVAEHCAEQCPH